MILFGTEVGTNSDFKVVKVIEPVYQIMYEIAYHTISLAAKQAKVYKYLIDFIDEHYPGWGIQNFLDLSSKEALDIGGRSGNYSITWGMYVLLQRGVPHIQRRTEYKQIEDNATRHREIEDE